MEDVAQQPRVAVIIPAYNAAATIDRAIQSIERQTYTNWEIVVADDASTDDTAVRAARHAGIKVISLPCNCGSAKARDVAVENTTADIIAMLDADDEAHPERLEIQVGVLQALEQRLGVPVLLFTGRLRVTTDGRRWLQGGAAAMSGRVWLTDRDDVMAGRHYLMGATLMMRRDAWLELGGQALSDVDEEFDLYARAVNRGHAVAHVGLPLYVQHITPHSRQHYVVREAERFERILGLWNPANPGRIPDRAVDEETYRLMCLANYRLLTALFMRKRFFAQARETAKKAEAFGRLPWSLRWGARVPALYHFVDKRKRRVAEYVFAWRSRAFLRTIDACSLPLRDMVSLPCLEASGGA